MMGNKQTAGQAWLRATSRRTAPTDEPDFYRTWPPATRALCRLERLSEVGTIWEPACGDGAMSEVMIAEGCDVASTDLHDRGYGYSGVDFLNLYDDLTPRFDAIVTNPPFARGQVVAFADRALRLAKKRVILFGRLTFLEGKRRRAWFGDTGLTRVWVSSARIPMAKYEQELQGRLARMVAFAWFVWDLEHPPKRRGRWTGGHFDWEEHAA